ncbi:MAG: F0F1 ATP synthase subunit B [Treponema sp.]|jgi:F-type H+-transporting ATPase subunit b|nr:F0F1 ATP synthase subunit B [Treponema sp.]
MINPSLATFLVTIVNIALLFVILRALLFKPVSKFMADRTKKVEDALAQAEKEKNQAKQLLASYEEQIRQAEGEAGAIIREAREASLKEADRIIAEGKAAAENMIAAARGQINAEKQAALAVFKAEAAALVVAAASRLLLRDLNQEDNRRLAASLLAEIARGNVSPLRPGRDAAGE